MDSVSHAPRLTPGGAIAVPLAASPPARAKARHSPYILIAAASVLLATVSLSLQAAPGYDPWAWVIWGREIAHLSLITIGGPTWKPLPVLFTTAFAPFGAAAPELWLVVARAGGLAAVGLAALTASRLAGGRGPRALVAASLTAAGLLTLYGFVASVMEGESEGLLAALLLLAILRHLDGKPRQTFALVVAAALLRPETWPFVAFHGVVLWRRDPAARVMIAGSAAAIAALWFLPELWGSGWLLRGISWARYPRSGSPALARCPACAELTGSAWPLLVMPLKVGVVMALVAAGRGGPGRRLTAALALCGIGWILEEALLTQLGFSGNDRYLLAPVGVLVAAGAGGLASLPARPRFWIVVAAAAVLLSVPAYGKASHLGAALRSLARERAIRTDLAGVVERAGGRAGLLACGPIETNPSEAPLAAWTLRVPLSWTESGHGRVVIVSPGSGDSAPAPALPAGTRYRLIASAGSVRLFKSC